MSKWEARLKKVEGLAQAFQRSPLTTPYKPRLWPCQPCSTWKLFPRQNLAIGFAQTCKQDVHVFALEKEQATLGQRMFLVTSYSELWHYYRTYQQSLMHCYEVIPEGAICKLYFDLEFDRPSNRGLDGKGMVAFLIGHVCEQLLEVYGVACSPAHVLNLDSSTEEKFSRHLVFALCDAAFKDNLHMGRFVHAILGQTPSTLAVADVNSVTGGEAGDATYPPQPKRRRPVEGDLSCLAVKDKRGRECHFVDLGVYTKNRNFRLYKSSKVGKNVAFTLAEDNQFLPKLQKNLSAEESIFLASLVCNVSYTGQRILTWDKPEGTERKATTHLSEQESNASPGTLGGYKYSPYKEVDDFVLTVIKKDGVQGCIRRWNYFVSEQLLVYDILKYRWCENVRRFHKSNNIMILVDLKEEVWYQRCHDPACRTYRSSSFPLPQEICLSYLVRRDEDEEDQKYVMDAAGNIEFSQTPPPPGGEDAPPCARGEAGADWADGTDDDQACVDALDDFERST